MKRFGKKGVSPVIATILLIALTVAAVGIVAVILTSLSPTGIGKNVILTLKKVENDTVNQEAKVVLTNWGPDEIISGDLSIEFAVNYDGGWERGFAAALPDTGGGNIATISWVTGNPPTLTGAGMWPWKVGSGAEISIIFKGADAQAIQLVSLVVKDASSGTVFFTESNLPLPT